MKYSVLFSNLIQKYCSFFYFMMGHKRDLSTLVAMMTEKSTLSFYVTFVAICCNVLVGYISKNYRFPRVQLYVFSILPSSTFIISSRLFYIRLFFAKKMSSVAAFFVGLILGIVLTIITFYAIYMKHKQTQISIAAESYTSINRQQPKWF